MKKLMAGVFVAVAVLALSAVIAAGARSTQASSDRDPQATGAEDTSRLKGSAQVGDEDAETKKKPFLGITIFPVDPAKAAELEIDGGAVVGQVLDDGPSAGILHRGDIIVAINGDAVTTLADVSTALSEASPGDVLSLTVMREEETLDVEVTLGEHEGQTMKARITKRFRQMPDLNQDMLNYVRKLQDKFVRAELVMETDDGFKTFRAVAGTVSDVNVGDGTFVLTPKDGSDPVTYTISEDTVVNMNHTGDLGGLNSEDNTLVVDVDGEVKLVNQGDMTPQSRFQQHRQAGPRFKMHKQIRRPQPSLRNGQPGPGLRGGLGQSGGFGALGDNLRDILPQDMIEKLEKLHSENGNLDINIDVQADGFSGALRELVCDEEVNDLLPNSIAVRCTNLDTQDTQ